MGWLRCLRTAWFRRETRRRLQLHGWTAMYIGDYGGGAAWAYSVGFTKTLGQPEIIVFDLPQRTVNELFWQVFEELRNGTLRIEDGQRWEGVDSRCVWRRVHADQRADWLTLSFYPAVFQGGDFTAYQLVLSDKEGHLPWEAGYDERLRRLQPALYEPPAQTGPATPQA